MYTNTTVRGVAAAVVGARHLRGARNGQDAAALWLGRSGTGAVVVCDGCGAGASSEVGARLGSRLIAAQLATRLSNGARPADRGLWDEVRCSVAAELARLAAALGGSRETAIHDHLLFTIVAAAVADGELAVWAIGDGAYRIDGDLRVLGPFPDNQPPYLAYDLLGAPPQAELIACARPRGTVVIATDGVAELGLDALGQGHSDPVGHLLGHPDRLRRELVLHARSSERIDWNARAVARAPARLQDDGAVGVLRWEPVS